VKHLAFLALLSMSALGCAKAMPLDSSPTATLNATPVAPGSAAPCPSITINGAMYSLEVCEIVVTMVSGQGDVAFTPTIMTTAPGTYGFSVQAYGVGFPTYGILGISGGGANGNTKINMYFNDNILTPGTYNGYLPIHVYQGSETNLNDGNWLDYRIKLVVTAPQKG